MLYVVIAPNNQLEVDAHVLQPQDTTELRYATLPVYTSRWPCSLNKGRRSTDGDGLSGPVLLSEQYP
jgi:hypothetical protein